jgi:predicted HTH domain antitoxin
MDRRRSKTGRMAAADIDEALLDYERELISLGRLAELLGLTRDEATTLVESRGLPLRVGPRTVEEALEEVRALRQIQSQ